MAHTTTAREGEPICDLEGYDELMQSFMASLPAATLQSFLASLAPEDRLAGLAPEDRLAGLAPEEVMEALPVDVLRHFSEEYIASLPESVQAVIRKRLDD